MPKLRQAKFQSRHWILYKKNPNLHDQPVKPTNLIKQKPPEVTGKQLNLIAETNDWKGQASMNIYPARKEFVKIIDNRANISKNRN